MKDWIKKLSGGIVGGLLGGGLGLLVLALAWRNYNVFGNVADWISGIGSISAIMGVWWQSRQEKNLLKLQLENEKEQAFQQRRQLFKLNIAGIRRDGQIGYLPIVGPNSRAMLYELIKVDYLVNSQVDIVEISNISDKDLIAVHVVFAYENNKTVKFNIDSIESHSKIDLASYLENNFYTKFWNIVISEIPEQNLDYVLSFKLNNIWENQLEFSDLDGRPNKEVEIEGYDNLAKKIDKLFKKTSILNINKSKKIIVYYMTSMREKIRLVFEQNDNGIFHQKNLNMLEHKDGWSTKKGQEEFKSFDEEYNLNNFQESETF